MATYQLTHAAWLAHEKERVSGVLLQNLDPGVEYTVAEILALLRDFGLDYSNPEYMEIGPELIADGLIEEC